MDLLQWQINTRLTLLFQYLVSMYYLHGVIKRSLVCGLTMHGIVYKLALVNHLECIAVAVGHDS